MLLCKDCDYYHALSGNGLPDSGVSFCEFADTLFLDDVDDLETEYPCKPIRFGEYLKKKAACRRGGAAAGNDVNPQLFRELKECGVCTLKFPAGALAERFGGRAETPRPAVLKASGTRKE